MKTLFILFALLLALAAPVAAQTSITTTTITEPVTSPAVGAITLTVAATTGMAANGILYVDGSVYRILSISSLDVRVIQTQRPATHLDNASVYVVPVGAQIGLNPVGSCIRGTAGAFPQYSPYTLMFNLTTGDVWRCAGNLGSRIWVGSNPYAVGSASNNPAQTP